MVWPEFVKRLPRTTPRYKRDGKIPTGLGVFGGIPAADFMSMQQAQSSQVATMQQYSQMYPPFPFGNPLNPYGV